MQAQRQSNHPSRLGAKRRAPQDKVIRSRGVVFRARALPVTTNKPRSNSERTIEAVSSTKRHLSTRFQQLKDSGTPADAFVLMPARKRRAGRATE
jgi:hypothetical protein